MLSKGFFTGLSLLTTTALFSQPFVDVLNYSSQFYKTTYKDSLHTLNHTNDNILNIFIPKQFRNGNVLIIRANAEQLRSTYGKSPGYISDLYSFSMPLGFQFVARAKKDSSWRILVMAIPKLAGDLQDGLTHYFQCGGTALCTWQKSDRFKLKFGLYYNKECFGDFFVPLLGMDWKATDRLSFYGLLPNNFRMEIKCTPNFYTGIGFRNFKRSYKIQTYDKYDLVLVKETLVKVFADYYITKKIVLFAEGSYGLDYSLLQYDLADPKTRTHSDPVYSEMNNGFLFNVGLAFRIRKE